MEAVYGRFVPMQVRTRMFRPGMFRPITSSSHCKFVPWMFHLIYIKKIYILYFCDFYGVTKWIKSCLLSCFGTFKMPILMFISILVFRPEAQIWNPVRRDTKIYVRRILNASRISKTHLNSSTISPS